jgi:hypothetical protein
VDGLPQGRLGALVAAAKLLPSCRRLLSLSHHAQLLLYAPPRPLLLLQQLLLLPVLCR